MVLKLGENFRIPLLQNVDAYIGIKEKSAGTESLILKLYTT